VVLSDQLAGGAQHDLDGIRFGFRHGFGVLNYEMESATLLTMCTSQGLRAGMVAGVIVNRTQQEIPNAETMAKTESDAIKIVLGAARKLI
jgi:uridine phosphorylase